MRYLSIDLIGYAGIYNGLGLNHIAIDFRRCMYNKIIIRGKNGSGKSTLMTAISLMPDSNDMFIPGAEARKTVSVLHKCIEYTVRYIHAVTASGGRSTTKAYISKNINGVQTELNPNGNVTSCKDIIYDEFGLDANYIALSKVSSENRGLVDSKPAERKKIINAIMNTLETYNTIYKTLNKKSSAYKTLINSITYKMNHIGDETAVVSRLAGLDTRIGALEDDRSKSIEVSAAIKLKISEYEKILLDNNYMDVVKELKSIERDIARMQADISNRLNEFKIDDISKVDSFMKYMDTQIVSIESEISAQSSLIPTWLNQREIEFAELQNKQEKLASLQSEYNYMDIRDAMQQAKAIVDEYDKVFMSMGLTQVDLITKDEYDSAMESLAYLINQAKVITNLYSTDQLAYVVANKSTVESQTQSIQILNDDLSRFKEERLSIESSIVEFNSKREITEILKTRPSKCKIDDCPYIKTALEADQKYPLSQLQALSDRLAGVCAEIDNLNATIEQYSTNAEILSVIRGVERELESKIRFIRKLPVRVDFKESFIDRMINLDPFNDMIELYTYVEYSNILEEYKLAKRQLHDYEIEYKIYESKNSIIEELISSIEELTKKTNELASNIDNLNSFILQKQDALEKCKSVRAKIESLSIRINENLKPSMERREELAKIKSTLENNTAELDELRKNLDINSRNLGAINNDIKRLSDERESLRHSLSLLMEYKNELTTYNSKYTMIEKLKYYSSPSTGIQTLFMQMYMNNIISTANELLAMLFDGEFSLQPFVITEQEFRIPCIGNGLMHDDISSMSSAQKSMISLILSAVLLSKSSVLSLDEVDGLLDTGNRGYFAEFLDRIMYTLKCEQCFIVSHNSELPMSTADLIVLRTDPGENYSGNVIWHF